MTNRAARVLPLGLLLAIACGSPPAPKPAEPSPTSVTPVDSSAAMTEPAPVPIAPLRTGEVPVEAMPVVLARAVAKGVDGEHEILRVPIGSLGLDDRPHVFAGESSVVSVDGVDGFAAALVKTSPPAGNDPMAATPSFDLWIRRPEGEAGKPARARVFIPAFYPPQTGLYVPIDVDVSAAKAGDLTKGWRNAVRTHIDMRGTGLPFQRFAVDRLADAKPKAEPPQPELDWVEWSYLMELTSGAGSLRAALQEQSRLRSEVDRFRPTLPFASMKAPEVRRHPWKAMLAALKTRPPDEPLARATPAAFYFVRAADVGALFELLDEIDAWGTPLMHLVEGRTTHRRLSRRYRTQLGLPGSELSKLLGPRAMKRLALVGSDPFLRQGSDVTLIAEAASATVLRAGFDRELTAALAGRGEAQRSTVEHQGVTIAIARSADGTVSQHRAAIGELHLVSNSLAAIRRVIDTIAGRAPALSDELDFQYMLARDARTRAQVLAYAGDAFIANAIGPRSRILDARRQVALAELERPAFAALLHGWVVGTEPTDRKQLLASKLLLGGDLRHFDGTAIAFEPGTAPRSSWGRPHALTPILDLPDPAKITKTEQEAYRRFANHYETVWSDALDPIALRVSLDEVEGRRQLHAKLRVLPLLRNRDYMQLNELVGNEQLVPGRLRYGARLVFAIAPDSELRRELTSTSRAMLGRDLKLDWVGDYGMVGILDRPELANALHRAGLAPELPHPDQDRDGLGALMKLPLYVAVDVKQRTTAAMMLTVLRAKLADEGDFSNHGEHRGATIVEAAVDRDVRVYYALSDRALYVAFQPWVVEQLLDQEAEGDLPHAPADGEAAAGQASFEVKARQGGGMVTAIQWLFEAQARSGHAEGAAEMLLLGAPSTRKSSARYETLSLAYLGAIPFTIDGKPYALEASGATDPRRGNVYHLKFPAVPAPGSPADAVLSALELFRAQIGFEREPTPAGGREERSLSVGVTIGRRE